MINVIDSDVCKSVSKANYCITSFFKSSSQVFTKMEDKYFIIPFKLVMVAIKPSLTKSIVKLIAPTKRIAHPHTNMHMWGSTLRNNIYTTDCQFLWTFNIYTSKMYDSPWQLSQALAQGTTGGGPCPKGLPPAISPLGRLPRFEATLIWLGLGLLLKGRQ